MTIHEASAARLTRTEKSRINRELQRITACRPRLGDFLDQAQALNPKVSFALEGIWCGREGSVFELLDGEPCGVKVTWYNGRVEVAYLS